MAVNKGLAKAKGTPNKSNLPPLVFPTGITPSQVSTPIPNAVFTTKSGADTWGMGVKAYQPTDTNLFNNGRDYSLSNRSAIHPTQGLVQQPSAVDSTYGPSQTPYPYGMSQEALDAGMNVSGGTNSNWLNGMSNFETAQAGLGLFNTGFNMYDNLWGGGAKLRDKQMGLLDAQLADAQYNLKNKQGYDQSIRDAFGKKGLA